MPAKIQNAMTVDVEDYFQVSAFEQYIKREEWDSIPHRVVNNVDLVLDLFEKNNVKATFFMLGWVAERHPEIVRKIVNRGHELASHGFSHVRITEQDRNGFRKDIRDTKKLLEDIAGHAVIGYRAASFSINAVNHWAHRELEEAGYAYSSSIYPIKHDLYGIPESPRFPYHPEGLELLEIPVTTLRFRDWNLPCGGGGYFRLLPYPLSRVMLNRVNRNEQKPCVFYFHPWELDPDQPRTKGINFKTRFRHYTNLGVMKKKMSKLLSDFRWDRVDRVFEKELRIDKKEMFEV